MRATWRAAVLAGLVLGGVTALTTFGAVPLASTTDGVVVAAQLARAETLTAADLLILGDSSALTGVDVEALGTAMGRPAAQSLALIGFAGPAAYGAMLDRLTARGVTPDIVLLLLHRESLVSGEEVFTTTPYERAVLGRPAQTAREIARDTKTWLASRVRDAIGLPLPAAWGVAYTSPEGLRRHIATHRGSMVDPSRLPRSTGGGIVRYAVSDAVARRLPSLAHALAAARPRCVALGLMPGPLDRARHELGERRILLQRLAVLLRVPESAILDLPASLPDTMFATSTHLSADGRPRYTDILINALRGTPGCEG